MVTFSLYVAARVCRSALRVDLTRTDRFGRAYEDEVDGRCFEPMVVDAQGIHMEVSAPHLGLTWKPWDFMRPSSNQLHGVLDNFRDLVSTMPASWIIGP